ncbi:MAG TPA: glutamine--fructose-6-phosphate transaminase (isomerizing) [Holophaga sp.]|jgi:glucosamine--fructose-6-phosphate aminotransferase (isomerizing)|nr:glutamine--fructose-6-phosphate transaminase (isomerizing) [Holophaga sp.]
MCGIVGAVAEFDIVPVLLEGLRRLEYRGYDSCGVAIHLGGGLDRIRSASRVSDLKGQVEAKAFSATSGIAHTRWATHGAPETRNAHPHFSRGEIGLVHNGIIENYEELREELRAKGYQFDSATDTETIAHLIHSLYDGDLREAVRLAVARLKGAYAIAVVSSKEPNRVVGARFGSPLVAGIGERAVFMASDAMALAGSADTFYFLEEGDIVDLLPGSCRVFNREGDEVKREAKRVAPGTFTMELGPYRHFMQKEIFEQPEAIANTLEGVECAAPSLFGAQANELLKDIDGILILACGTSYYAASTARYWLESIAKVPTRVEIASEYRYRDSVPNPRNLIVAVSQSGETADTLAAIKHAQSLGHDKTLAICNVAGSALMRQTALGYVTRAGAEIGVASTKAFTTQLTALYLLTLTLAKLRGHLESDAEAAALRQLRHLPSALGAVLALEPQVMAWAERFAPKQNALFLGRGMHYPIAMEGALKLKEISYIHAEAYPAGELKHGPLALVTGEMPVVTVAPNDQLLEKLKSNMQEVRARGGELYVFADAGIHIESGPGINVIRMPEHYGMLSPILHVLPMQLLAYHTAVARGTDVDKPRNLAKSVTVE